MHDLRHLPPKALEIILRNAPYNTNPHGQPNGTYLFIYDHHLRYTEFVVTYPGSNLVGLAWLRGWKWHLNFFDQPNLRPDLEAIDHETKCITDPKSGVMGYVFHVSTKTELDYFDALNAVSPRIRKEQEVRITSIAIPPQVATLKTIVYIDPLNIHSANMGAKHTNLEKMKYFKGMDELLSFGAPRWAIEKVYQELYCGKSKETGVEEAGGLFTMDMFCNRKTLGLHKDDPRRVGTLGYCVTGARNLLIARQIDRARREEEERKMRANIIKLPEARQVSKGVGMNGQGC